MHCVYIGGVYGAFIPTLAEPEIPGLDLRMSL
jgi:hypothetical protein